MTDPDMAKPCPETAEITPEMEAAGVWALRTTGIGLLCAEDWEVREVAHELYLAAVSRDYGRGRRLFSSDP
jgi:hypothetical protein